MNVNWLVLSACVLLPLAAMAGAGQGSENVDPTRAPWAEAQAPWTNPAKPGDVVKDHVELITVGHQAYTVVQGGTIDGRSCRYSHGRGHEQGGRSGTDVGVEPRPAHREHRRYERDQPLALQRAQRLPHGEGDRRVGRQARHDRRREGEGHLVAGLPPPLPRRRPRRRRHGPRADLQRLRLLRVRGERHRAGRALARGRAEGRPLGRDAQPYDLARLLRRRLALPGRRPTLRLPAARQRDGGQRPGPGARP